eukprot:4273075-Amphidinium_carterae.1
MIGDVAAGAGKVRATIQTQTPEIYSMWSVLIQEVKTQWRKEWKAEWLKEQEQNNSANSSGNVTRVNIEIQPGDEVSIKRCKHSRASASHSGAPDEALLMPGIQIEEFLKSLDGSALTWRLRVENPLPCPVSYTHLTLPTILLV